MGKKGYLGIALDGNQLKIARINKGKGIWKLSELYRLTIKEETAAIQQDDRSKELVKEYNEDFHFGINQSYDENSHTTTGSLDSLMELDSEENNHDSLSANVVELRDKLEDLNQKKMMVGLTIPTGVTNFQVLKDKSYSQLKTKEVTEFIEGHLQKVYGLVPDSDNYRYQIREDGSLLLASYKEKPYLLKLLDGARRLYSGKLKIKQMLADEALLAGLIKKNYKLDKNEITCVIHMGADRSRVFFMRGDQIQYTMSPIDEGRESPSVLDIIFSKILFQLDTGELTGLDRILITNNELDEVPVDYFRKQFQDLEIDEFRFKPDYIQVPDHLRGLSTFFTSAIGAAIAAAKLKDPDFSEFAMLPAYVRERQNVLKLRWHGIILLLLILATPVAWNYLYQNKTQQIKDLNDELFRTELGIADLDPVVKKAQNIQNNYKVEQAKMNLLNDLSDGAFYWSNTLKTLNDGLGKIRHVWIDRIKYGEDGFWLQGYSTTQSRIPRVANLFQRADLQAVSVVDMRGIKVYKFSIKVYNNYSDDIDSKFNKVSNAQNNK